TAPIQPSPLSQMPTPSIPISVPDPLPEVLLQPIEPESMTPPIQPLPQTGSAILSVTPPIVHVASTSHQPTPFDERRLKQVIFRAAFWMQNWAILSKEEEKKTLKMGGQKLEIVAASFLKKAGWNTTRRIQM
ncbi:unnamed protein product, partial [Urochloa humidicola]